MHVYHIKNHHQPALLFCSPFCEGIPPQLLWQGFWGFFLLVFFSPGLYKIKIPLQQFISVHDVRYDSTYAKKLLDTYFL